MTPLEALKYLQVLLPEWKYIAMDESGEWFIYKDAPELDGDCWLSEGECDAINSPAIKFEGDRKESLFTTEANNNAST